MASVNMSRSTGLKDYTGGIIDSKKCTDDTGHTITLIGFGTDKKTGKEYMLGKNSWGAKWGEKGYFKLASHMKYSSSGVCGWASNACEI